MRRLAVFAALLVAGCAVGWVVRPTGLSAADASKLSAPSIDLSIDANNPMGANGACYVCHVTFVRETLSKSHLKAKVGCIQCHGVSSKHANDENIGATKPDVTFKREGVDPMCVKCHEGHNVSAKRVIKAFLDRGLSTGEPPTCTQCHGTHKIDRGLEGLKPSS